MTDPNTVSKHRLYEDAAALVTGTLVVSLGLAFYTKAVLITNGMAGLSLLLQYASGVGFPIIFFLINLPFYWLAVRRMGWSMAVRTFIAIALVSVFARLTPEWIGIANVDPVYAAVVGGALMGLGLLILFRHRTGLGGTNILALYLQDRYGIRAGWFQLGVDSVIVSAAFFVVEPEKVALSLLGATVLNLIIAINHRPGRYTAVS
ncbi:YitT family protein [Azospirillum halopraeferens]|uniref:YitT family protein n=1 Tax=Azospirillum halopraeferens TaxID=34010 RepID=UPI00040E0E09|nr:YitT family protein [Azospirillum halopraeferens]